MAWTHTIKSLGDFSDDEFDKITTIYPECFTNKLSKESIKLLGIQEPLELMVSKSGIEFIFMCLLHKYKTNNIYISDVCVPKKWRGKGVMESAFEYITEHYGKKGKYYLTLTASNENNQNLNQKRRLKIFNKHDFYLSPKHITITGYGSGDGEAISVNLTNGKRVNVKSGPLKQEGMDSKYIVSDSNGQEFQITMNDVEACFTKAPIMGHSPVHCPMKKTLKKGGRRRRPRSRTHKYI